MRDVWRTIRRLPLRQGLAVARRLRLARGIAALSPRPDLLVSQFAWITADICSLVSRATGIPWVCRCHAWDVFAQPLPALKNRLESAKAVIPCTQAAADRLAEAGLPPDKIHLVRHGIPETGACPHTTLQGLSPSETETKTILAVGRLEPKKGFDTLIDAFAILSGSVPKTEVAGSVPTRSGSVPFSETGFRMRLEIVGDGSQRDRLEAAAKKAEWGQTPNTIQVAGARPHREVLERIARADVFALPSRRLGSGDMDGVANVILEAMAAGTPVVTTTGGCAGEVITDGVNGLLVPPDDPVALAAAIGRILSDGDLARELASNARKTVESAFSGEAAIGRLSRILRDCIR